MLKWDNVGRIIRSQNGTTFDWTRAAVFEM